MNQLAQEIVDLTVADEAKLRDAVEKYAAAKHALATVKRERTAQEAPYLEEIAKIKKEFEVQVSSRTATESAAKVWAQLVARMAKEQGLFGEKKARYQLDGIGYAEVQKPKFKIEVTDLGAFLASALAKALIVSVEIDRASALRLFEREAIPGMERHRLEPVVRISTSKWRPQEETEEKEEADVRSE